MLFTLEAAQQSVRTQDGKRVFWLSPEDRLTPAAQDWLRGEKIEVTQRPTGYYDLFGGKYAEKPEEMTHLSGNLLVPKTHRRIAFRGALDHLQAQMLLCGLSCPEPVRAALGEMLNYLRTVLRCEVLDEPLASKSLLGLSLDELRQHSHTPQKFYAQSHFQPDFSDGTVILLLNDLRAAIRETELACCRAFSDMDGKITRPDLVRGLNRLSSACYILMIRQKAEKEGRWSSSSNR